MAIIKIMKFNKKMYFVILKKFQKNSKLSRSENCWKKTGIVIHPCFFFVRKFQIDTLLFIISRILKFTDNYKLVINIFHIWTPDNLLNWRRFLFHVIFWRALIKMVFLCGFFYSFVYIDFSESCLYFKCIDGNRNPI